MTTASFLWTVVCVIGIATGQILFKMAARSAGPDVGLAALVNPWLFAALVLYGGATMLWIHVLRSTPLAVAYPLFALAFVIVPILSATLLGEPLRSASMFGGALIVAGVVVSTRGVS